MKTYSINVNGKEIATIEETEVTAKDETKDILKRCQRLTLTEKLELCCQILNIGMEFDNHGQVVLYTGLSLNAYEEAVPFDTCKYNSDFDSLD